MKHAARAARLTAGRLAVLGAGGGRCPPCARRAAIITTIAMIVRAVQPPFMWPLPKAASRTEVGAFM